MGITRTLTLAFTVTAVVAGACIGLTAYLIAGDALLAEAGDHLLANVLARQDELRETVESMEGDIRLLADTPWVQEVLGDSTLGDTETVARDRAETVARFVGIAGDRRVPPSVAERVIESASGRPEGAEGRRRVIRFLGDRGYSDLYLVDAGGRLVHQVGADGNAGCDRCPPQQIDPSLADAVAAVTRQRRAGVTVLVDARPGPDGGPPIPVILAAPVMSRDSGFLGVVALAVPVDRITGSPNQLVAVGAGGDVVVVGPDGRLRTDSPLVDRPTGLRVHLSDAAILRAANGQTGVEEVLRQTPATGRPEPALAAFAPVAVGWNTWVVVASRPMDQVLRPLHRMGRLSLVAGLVILGLVSLASLWVARSITRPVADLSEAMLRLAGGDIAAGVPHRDRGDELGAVAAALDSFKHHMIRVGQLTEEVDRERQLLAGTFQAMDQGIAVIDAEHRLVVHNDRFAALLELDPARLTQGATPADLAAAVVDQGAVPVMPDDEAVPSLDIAHDLAVVGDPGDSGERLRRTRAGRCLAIRALPLDRGGGRSGGRVLVLTDLTDRVRQEQALRIARDQAQQAARAKSEFLATMSHEIRTPMNGILAMAALLDQSRLDEDQRGLLRVVRQSGEDLLTVINDILDVSRIEAGKLAIDVIEMSLLDVVEGVGDLVNLRAEEKGLDLSVEYAPAVPERVFGDPTRLRQVLFNLAGNAVKFTERGGVALRVLPADRGDRWVRFEVTDTGIGLTEEQMARLFQPFSQADGSTARRYGGTGLGLSICRGLCDLMGAEIGVASRFGQGATFWFDLRLPPAGAGVPRAPPVDAARVLCIGQPQGTLAVLEAHLVALGIWSAAAVETAEEALVRLAAMVPEDRPNLVLLNAEPGNPTLRMLSRVLAGAGPDGAPIATVLTCSRAVASTLQEADRIGPFPVLTHPIRRDRLHRVVAAALGLASLDEARPVQPMDVAWQAPDRHTARAAGALVLVAEDNAVNQMVIRRLLDRLGIAHDLAANGYDALDRLRDGPYGLLLTDFHMPDMDGFELTTRIRHQEAARGDGGRLPIFALTADALTGTRDRCLAAGMDGTLGKPIDLGALTAVLERYVPAAFVLRRRCLPDSPQEAAPPGISPPAGPAVDPDIFDPAVLTEAFGGFDDDSRALLAHFLERSIILVAEATAMPTATGDRLAAMRAAHSIKGSASSIGAHRLSRVAGALQDAWQDALQSGDAAQLQPLGQALVAGLDEFAIAVAPWLPASVLS